VNISKANEILPLIANIGVIASIIFLGIEMQQNTDMMQSQTRNSIVENQLALCEGIIDNSDFARIAYKLRVDQNAYPAGTAERCRYIFFAMSQFRMREIVVLI